MFIQSNSLDYVTEINSKLCDFHQKYPELKLEGCGCSISFVLRGASPEERIANAKSAAERGNRKAQARREFPGIYII